MITASQHAGEFATAQRQWDASMRTTIAQAVNLAILFPHKNHFLASHGDRDGLPALHVLCDQRRVPVIRKAKLGAEIARPELADIFSACRLTLFFHRWSSFKYVPQRPPRAM